MTYSEKGVCAASTGGQGREFGKDSHGTQSQRHKNANNP